LLPVSSAGYILKVRNSKSSGRGAKILVMKTNTPTSVAVSLTEAERQAIYEMSRNPDPLSRIQSNYYELRSRELYEQYATKLLGVDYHDYNDRVRLQENHQEQMDKLRHEYDLDIQQAISLHLTIKGITAWPLQPIPLPAA